MVAKVVNIHDISYLQNNIIGLPFMIVDTSSFLFSMLHDEVNRRTIGSPAELQTMCNVLSAYVTQCEQVQRWVCGMHSKCVHQVEIEYYVDEPFLAKGQWVQIVGASIAYKLNDSTVRLTQDPVIFILNEGKDKWVRVAKIAEPKDGEEDAGVEKPVGTYQNPTAVPVNQRL